MKGIKDKYGRIWNLPKEELCPVCKQPDNCGDCDHHKLAYSDFKNLNPSITRVVEEVRYEKSKI